MTTTIGEPSYGATFAQGVRNFWGRSVDFRGRASQSEYWWAQLFLAIYYVAITLALIFLTLILGVASISSSNSATAFGALGLVFLVLVGILVPLIPSISLMVRRLRDAGMSPWLALLILVPLVSYIWPLIVGFFPTAPRSADYGSY